MKISNSYIYKCQGLKEKQKSSPLLLQKRRNKIKDVGIRLLGKVSKNLISKEKEAPHKIQSVSSVWDGAKDGKRYRKNATVRDMRK